MASPCVICMGQSGKPLAGKRCTAAACKNEYAKRKKFTIDEVEKWMGPYLGYDNAK